MGAYEVTNKLIAKRLRYARQLAGLSHRQSAKLMAMEGSVILELEEGERALQAEELEHFADVYGVSAFWLAGKRSDEPDLRQPGLSVISRQLSKLSDKDREQIMQFIAAIQAPDVEEG